MHEASEEPKGEGIISRNASGKREKWRRVKKKNQMAQQATDDRGAMVQD